MKLERGFTLVEVLIASTILFTVLAVASEAYRNALLASSKAQTLVEMLTPLPLMTSSIRNQLRTNPVERLQGEAELLGVQYRWEAVTARYGAPAPRFDPDEAEFIEYGRRYRLYDVTLELSLRGQQRNYLYQELAWEPWANLRR
jgi:prepilin-type N-terminal cleavage/methylation domain-containing protein